MKRATLTRRKADTPQTHNDPRHRFKVTKAESIPNIPMNFAQMRGIRSFHTARHHRKASVPSVQSWMLSRQVQGPPHAHSAAEARARRASRLKNFLAHTKNRSGITLSHRDTSPRGRPLFKKRRVEAVDSVRHRQRHLVEVFGGHRVRKNRPSLRHQRLHTHVL